MITIRCFREKSTRPIREIRHIVAKVEVIIHTPWFHWGYVAAHEQNQLQKSIVNCFFCLVFFKLTASWNVPKMPFTLCVVYCKIMYNRQGKSGGFQHRADNQPRSLTTNFLSQNPKHSQQWNVKNGSDSKSCCLVDKWTQIEEHASLWQTKGGGGERLCSCMSGRLSSYFRPCCAENYWVTLKDRTEKAHCWFVTTSKWLPSKRTQRCT